MRALKVLRRDLGDHLAAGLGSVRASLGKKVNPPAVVVQPGSPYVIAESYCDDGIDFAVFIIARPGDPEAVMDDLDDMVDLVRSTLGARSTLGVKYEFREVSGLTSYALGDTDAPAVIATVHVARSS